MVVYMRTGLSGVQAELSFSEARVTHSAKSELKTQNNPRAEFQTGSGKSEQHGCY